MEAMKRCTEMESKLADMLLDPDAAPAKVRDHVEQCPHCQEELTELQATMALLETWDAPGQVPIFLPGWTRKFGKSGRQRRRAGLPAARPVRLWAGPACASAGGDGSDRGAAAGGGAYLDVANWDQPAAPSAQAAVVHDLQTLDNNGTASRRDGRCVGLARQWRRLRIRTGSELACALSSILVARM